MSATAASIERDLDIAEVWVTCRSCDTDNPVAVVRSWDRLLDLPGEFQVVRCRRCGFLYTNPQPSDDVLARHYPPTYSPFNPAPSAEAACAGRLRARLRAGVLAARGYERPCGRLWRTLGWLASWVLAQRFVWLPPFVPGGTLVDVGCASGAYLAEMRNLGWNVMGVEPDAGAAAAARAGYGLAVRTATLERAGLPDRSANVVVMRMVLEHVRDPRRTLEEARRILKPGGRLLLSVPNAGSVEARLFGRYWFAWDLPRHLSHFTPESLTGLLREVGFGGIRVRHLVSANNLRHSLHYRRGGAGAPGDIRFGERIVAGFAAVLRTAGRIAAEAQRGEDRP